MNFNVISSAMRKGITELQLRSLAGKKVSTSENLLPTSIKMAFANKGVGIQNAKPQSNFAEQVDFLAKLYANKN